MANQQLTILLDMDEVLADFVGGACAAHGLTRDELYAGCPPGTWDMFAARGMTTDEFWGPIQQIGEPFWARLERLPWMALVLCLIDQYGEWFVVSAPAPGGFGAAGKMNWLRDVFGPGFDRYVLTPHKELLARPETLLIDDSEANVCKFRKAGGRGILFPFRGNRLWPIADRPVEYLNRALAAQKEGYLWSLSHAM